jgi:hypothetical protein
MPKPRIKLTQVVLPAEFQALAAAAAASSSQEIGF